MQPILNNVLVKPVYASGISDGGILIPDSFKQPTNKVIIVSVGSGTSKKPMTLKEGDIGFRVKDWGMDVMVENELHFLMDAGAILAKE